MDRAYALLEVKSLNDDERVIEGIASTPTPDRAGDIMEPKGAQFSLPIPLLWQHDQKQPIGSVSVAKVGADGIIIRAKFAKIDEPGTLKDRLDEAWQSVKAGLVRGLSIGWTPIEAAFIKDTGGLHVLKWLWAELSVVTIPQNVEATILKVKELDLAASGRPAPGVSGSLPVVRAGKAAPRMKTIAEQISAFEATRASKAARMTEIMTKAADEHVTLDAAQTEEYSGLETEVKAVDAHLTRLREFEKIQAGGAVPVKGTEQKTASESRSATPVIQVKSNLPPGAIFTRYVMTKAAANGDQFLAEREARRRWPDTPEVELLIKAAVAAGDTVTSGAYAELAVQQPINDFIALLRPKTLLGRIPNLRRVPFNVSVPAQTAGGTYSWVGQGKVKPLTKATTATVTLAINKIAGIIVLTQELVKISTPSAQDLVQSEMIAGITKFMDEQFIDPSVAASGTVSPASITNGTSAVTSAGTSGDNMKTDLKAVMSSFLTNNLSLSNSVWIMSESNAFAMAMAVNALGAPMFPGMQDTGNMFLFGRPVVATQSAGTTVALVDAQGILVADDGGVTVDVSKEASLQMDSAPTDPPDAAAVYVSMFQQNMIALRAERFVTWKRARTASVKYVAQTYV